MANYTHKTMILQSVFPDELAEFHSDVKILVDGRATLSEIVPGVVNGLRSFFIAPSGSKDDRNPQVAHTKAIKDVADMLSDTMISVDAIILTYSEDGRKVTTEVVENYFDRMGDD